MFKRDDLGSGFRIFLTGYRLFASIKNLIILLVTDLTKILKITFSNSVFSTKLSDLTQCF